MELIRHKSHKADRVTLPDSDSESRANVFYGLFSALLGQPKGLMLTELQARIVPQSNDVASDVGALTLFRRDTVGGNEWRGLFGSITQIVEFSSLGNSPISLGFHACGCHVWKVDSQAGVLSLAPGYYGNVILANAFFLFNGNRASDKAESNS